MAHREFVPYKCELCEGVSSSQVIDLSGKTVMCVGDDTDQNFRVLSHFARMKPQRLIITSRNAEQGSTILERLQSQTHYQAESWIMDPAEFDTVRQFIERFNAEGSGRLDLVILNPTAEVSGYNRTLDDWESLLQINFLSSSLLSLLLLPYLKETAEKHQTTTRIFLASKDAEFWSALEDDVFSMPHILHTLTSQEYCTQSIMQRRYHVTQLLLVLFARSLSERQPHDSHNVIVDATTLGYCYTRSQDSTGSGESTPTAPSQLGDAIIFPLTEDGVKIQERIWDEMVDALEWVDPTLKDVITRYLVQS